jgi:hypothetical protein
LLRRSRWPIAYCFYAQGRLAGGGNTIGFKSCNANVDAFGNPGIPEGFHCDGGFATFTLTDCGAVLCSYGVRIANVNSGSTQDPTLCYLSKISVDHSNDIPSPAGPASGVHGVSFESGSAMSLRDSFITSTAAKDSSNYAISVGPNFGGQLDIQNNDIVNNCSGGIRIAANDVIVQGNRIFANCTGAPQLTGFNLSGINIFSVTGGTGGIQIENNLIGQPFPATPPTNPTQLYGIDLAPIPAGSDWATIVGNVLGGNITGPILLPVARTNLGVHCRIASNPGYNPVDPAKFVQPAVPLNNTDQQNVYFADVMLVVIPGAATLTSAEITYPDETVRRVFVSGSFTGSGRIPVFLPCGGLIRLLYMGGTPTWVWFTM